MSISGGDGQAITGMLVFVGQISDTMNPPDTIGWVMTATMQGMGFVDTDVETRTDASGSIYRVFCELPSE